MGLVVVPNSLRDALQEAIAQALNGRPRGDEEREILYRQLLDYFNEHGRIPDFRLTEQSP